MASVEPVEMAPGQATWEFGSLNKADSRTGQPGPSVSISGCALHNFWVTGTLECHYSLSVLQLMRPLDQMDTGRSAEAQGCL